MKAGAEKIKSLVEQNLSDSSLFLVDVIMSGSGTKNKVKVILDGDNGITIEQCAEVSRRLSAELDESDMMDGSFVLEVTSPGIDHPIKLFRQYVKNIGRKVKVVLKDQSEKRGILKSVEEKFIEVETESKNKKGADKEKVEIPFEQIEKTNIQISFK